MFVGDGSKQMNCVYVEDVVQAAMLASSLAPAGARTTSPTGRPRRDFISFIADSGRCRCPGRCRRPRRGGLLHGRVGRASVGVQQAPLMNISRLRFLYYNQYYSIERAREELGYPPQYTYQEGLP